MRQSQQVFYEFVHAQRARLFYWLPALLGAGMATYYALPFEPSGWLYTAPLLLLLSLCAYRVSLRALALIMLAIALFALGASYAKWRTSLMDVQMLSEPLSIRPVTGIVDAIEHMEHGLRITLSAVEIENVDAENSPIRMRVSLRAKTIPDIEIGQRISLRAALLPPSGPVMENAFDFGRYFFFRNMGAVGFAIMPITIKQQPSAHGFFAFWRDARDKLTENIRRDLPGVQGAIAAGLITGDDSAIPQETYDQLRAANLIHIIAISGAHMVVIAGIIFVCLRALLVFIPRYGLHPNIKPIVAALTWLAISCYLCITGFELSAVRAYVMLSFLLLAILIRREAYAMRSIALAALLMLAIDPSDVIEPGFQLSFAATFALIAAFENMFRDDVYAQSRFRRWLRLVIFMLLTTIIAESATLPFVLFHFNNLALYGVFANLILTPIVTLIIMPMVALYFVLLPLGIESFALHLMAFGIDVMLWVARIVSGLPHALTYVPSPTPLGIALCAFGLLWLCIWRARVRWLGLPAIIIGVATSILFTAPHLFISAGMQQVALNTEKGFVLLRGRPDSLFAELWANGVGQKSFLTLREAQPIKGVECSRSGCAINRDGLKVHLSYTVPDIQLGCPKDADYWMSGFYLFPEERKSCAKNTQCIDRADFNAKGSMWGWFEKDELLLRFTADEQGHRPWSLNWRE